MRTKTLCFAALSTLLLLGPAARSFALPGEADAVIARCGEPTGVDENTSMISGNRRRDLAYGNLILHFEPDGFGWGFTSAWYEHLPLTRAQVAERIPCFRRAMADAEAQPEKPMDPTIAQQVAERRAATQNTLGVPMFWPMVGCALVLLFAIVWQYVQFARDGSPAPRRVIERQYRAPNLESFRTARARGTLRS